MQTEPQITFKNMETSPSLEALIRRRIDGLDQLHSRIIACRVVVEVPHRSGESGKVPLGISVEVTIPGRPTIVAKDAQERHDTKDDQTVPVNNAFDAVERQLERVSDIQNRDVKTTETAPQSGMVVRLFPDQSYGFVEVTDSPELYFTRNAVTGGDFDDIEVGMLVHVVRSTEDGPMGPQASSVKLLDKAKTLG